MKRWTGIILIIMAAVVVAGITVQAAEISAQPKVLSQPTPPAESVPGKQFSFYIPVNFSNLHPDVNKVRILCEVFATRLDTGVRFNLPTYETAWADIPITSGKYTGTVTIAFNIFGRDISGNSFDVNTLDNFQYVCWAIDMIKGNGENARPKPINPGNPVTWNSYRTGRPSASGPFP